MNNTETNNKYIEYAKWWESIWMTCGRKETAVFESNNLAYTEELIIGNARRNLMIWIYCLLRNYKKIKPIEELDQSEKQQIWAFVKEVCLGKTSDKKIMIGIAKTFYVIEYFLNEKIQAK